MKDFEMWVKIVGSAIGISIYFVLSNMGNKK
jgi:hypothetical protein